MPTLHLAAPTAADLTDLTAFEFTHRAYFETHINARPAAYYAPGGVAAAIEAAERERAAGTGYQFLVRDADGRLVGRVNLSRVRRAHFHSAEIGYRVAPDHGGRGIARAAVGAVLQRAFGELALHRVEACARPDNLGSVAVLVRHGFTLFGRSRRSFALGGAWHDLCHYECHAPTAMAA